MMVLSKVRQACERYGQFGAYEEIGKVVKILGGGGPHCRGTLWRPGFGI